MSRLHSFSFGLALAARPQLPPRSLRLKQNAVCRLEENRFGFEPRVGLCIEVALFVQHGANHTEDGSLVVECRTSEVFAEKPDATNRVVQPVHFIKRPLGLAATGSFAASRHEVRTELQQAFASPLLKPVSRLPARDKVAASDSERCDDNRYASGSPVHGADRSCGRRRSSAITPANSPNGLPPLDRTSALFPSFVKLVIPETQVQVGS